MWSRVSLSRSGFWLGFSPRCWAGFRSAFFKRKFRATFISLAHRGFAAGFRNSFDEMLSPAGGQRNGLVPWSRAPVTRRAAW